MNLRPQDLLVSMKVALAGDDPWTYPQLASALAMSLSEVHGAVKRATAAGLLRQDRRANRAALCEFIVHGAKYAFVPERGRLTRGVPTAHGAPPLDKLVGEVGEPPPVWPDPSGMVRGESFQPLCRSAPEAAKRDARLYEALCLVDAIRSGRARERAMAEKRIRGMLGA